MDWRRQQEQQTHNNNNDRGGTRRMRPLVDEQGGGGAAVGRPRPPGGGGGGGGGQQQQQQQQQRAGTFARTRASDEDDGGSERWKRVKVDGREYGLRGNWELDFYRDRAAWEVGNSQLGEGGATTMALGMMGGGGGQVMRDDSAGRSREAERFSGGVGRGQELERRGGGGGGSRRMRSPEEVVLQHESERDESSRRKRLKQEEGLGNGGSGRGREMGFASERDRDRENGRDLRMRDYERRGPHLERDGFRRGGGERTVFRPPPPRLNREGDSRERGGGEFQRDRSKIREKDRVGGGEPRNGEQKKKMEQPSAAALPPAKERRGEEQARKYQLEVLEQAKVKNTIAFLETGAGKTLIAVLLMKHKYETMRQQNQRMLAVFLVPKVPLVYQVKKNSLSSLSKKKIIIIVSSTHPFDRMLSHDIHEIVTLQILTLIIPHSAEMEKRILLVQID